MQGGGETKEGREGAVLAFPQWPRHGEAEIQAVVDVLRSGRTNYRTADQGRLFEEAFAARSGCHYGVATANGTLALELALESLGVGSGHEVIVPCRTYIATASCVARVGAKPVVADVDPFSQNLTARTIEGKLSDRTKAVVVVHLAGMPCDMDPILDLARRKHLLVVEDCAQAHGARYRGRPVGSLGHAGAFSFCHDKIMSLGGEGGMLVTRDEAVWNRARSLKDHGKNHDLLSKPVHTYPWPHETFGSNYRMTEMQAAMGRIQLERLDEWRLIRERNAALLTRFLEDLPCQIPRPAEHMEHAWYRYYLFPRLDAFRDGWDRDRVMVELNHVGVPCDRGSCSEIQRERAFEMYPDVYGSQTPVGCDLGLRSLAFPLHPTLREHHMEAMGREIRKILKTALR